MADALLCDPINGGPVENNCTSIFVQGYMPSCMANATEVCAAAAAPFEAVSRAQGQMWGMYVSIVCDVIISIGLAFQKVAHNSLAEARAEAKREGKPEPGVFKKPLWVMGMALVLGGEVGNFLAYGDANTPAAVVTAVGCVGIIANLIIATLILKEPFRRRDLVGVFFVIGGVSLVVAFAPQTVRPLTTEQFLEYLSSPQGIVVLVVACAYVVTFYFLNRLDRFAKLHVLFPLSMASMIGSLTVIACKGVSTWAVMTVQGISTGPFSDQIDYAIDTCAGAACVDQAPAECAGDNRRWASLNGTATDDLVYGCVTVPEGDEVYDDFTGNLVLQGLHQFANPWFYVCLVILAVTGVAQVKYINKGMENFGNSEVIPCHYVTFTLFSILGTSIFYHELTISKDGVCPQWVNIHFFVDGILLTFLGVFLITTGRGNIKDVDGSEAGLDDVDVDAVEGDAAEGEEGEEGGEARESVAALPPPGSRQSSARSIAGSTAGGVRPVAVSIDGRQRRESVTNPFAIDQLQLEPGKTRQSRAASVTAFIGALGGGKAMMMHTFDPTDHEKEAPPEDFGQEVIIGQVIDHTTGRRRASLSFSGGLGGLRASRADLGAASAPASAHGTPTPTAGKEYKQETV